MVDRSERRASDHPAAIETIWPLSVRAAVHSALEKEAAWGAKRKHITRSKECKQQVQTLEHGTGAFKLIWDGHVRRYS